MRKPWRLPDYDTGPTCFELISAILVAMIATPVVIVWWIAG